MAYSSIVKPTDYFNTVLWTGDNTARTISGVGFQPDWIWWKQRNGTDSHRLADSVRGEGSASYKLIFSEDSSAEYNGNDNGGSQGNINAITSDGFSGVQGSSGYNNWNGSSYNYVAWNWKGGTTSGLSGGNITPSAYSYDATSGFGVYKYTGNGSADQTIPHGLGAIPQLIFYKRLDSSTNWVVQSNLLGNRVQLVLNGTDAENTDSRLSDSDNWTSTFFKVGSYGDMNNNGSDHVAYVFCNVKGYCKIGKYTGNGSTDGTFIHTGFRPAWIMMKRTDTTGGWMMYDGTRDSFNLTEKYLQANETNAEATGSSNRIDIVSNGIKLRATGSFENASGGTYVYMAFAENPFVANDSGTAVPVVAR
jgi:hypothetical protein